jgi:hypothetical protein
VGRKIMCDVRLGSTRSPCAKPRLRGELRAVLGVRPRRTVIGARERWVSHARLTRRRCWQTSIIDCVVKVIISRPTHAKNGWSKLLCEETKFGVGEVALKPPAVVPGVVCICKHEGECEICVQA